VEPTPGGWWFLLITFGVGVSAINTGNNLLYLVLGMLLALILASGILSHMALLELSVVRSPPQRIFARTPFLMGLSATNGKARLPSFSLEIEELASGDDVAGTGKRCFFLKLPPVGTEQTSYRHTFERRGRHALGGFRIATRFPFGLFVKYLYVLSPIDLLVFPELREVPASAPRRGGRGEIALPKRGRHGDFFAARDYREGDDVADIHWRLSARAARPIVREREDESASRITLEIDNQLAEGLPEEAARAARDELEAAISLGASLAVHHLGRGEAVGITARGAALAHGAGPGQIEQVLRFLALLEPARAETGFRTLPGDVTVLRVGGKGAA
jgi:uncharacterized protein (DUF58 family)